MNPLDFLNQAIQRVMNPQQTAPSSEAQLAGDYANALINPLNFLEKAKAVVDKLNDQTRTKERIIDEMLRR